MRDKAAGFCYVQDVGLAIDLLRRQGCVRVLEAADEDGGTAINRFRYLPQTRTRRPRIMYLDLDIHFGDGVASACRHPYRYSNPATAQQLRGPKPSILTLSLHHYARGFFPANPEGGLTPIETSTPFNLSIPLNAGVSSPTYARLMSTCVGPIKDAFNPDYVVLLLGMDALHGDNLVDGAGNWSLDGEGGVAWVCDMIRSWNCRTLVLGGGGYNRLNTAKGWACATSVFVSLSPGLTEDVQS
jgi:histone deacetylase 1/2/histone deacetylase 8